MYIPEGWFHATTADEPTFGIAFQGNQVNSTAADRLRDELGESMLPDYEERTKTAPMHYQYEVLCSQAKNVSSEAEFRAAVAEQMEICKEVAAAQPENVGPLHNIGAMKTILKDLVGGRETFELAHQINPRDYRTLFGLIRSLALDKSQTANLPRAMDLAGELIKAVPYDPLYAQLEEEVTELYDDHYGTHKETLEKHWKERGKIKIKLKTQNGEKPSFDQINPDILPKGFKKESMETAFKDQKQRGKKVEEEEEEE